MQSELPNDTACKAMAGLKRTDFEFPLRDDTVYERIPTGKKCRVGKIDRVGKKVDYVWQDEYISKLIKKDETVPSVDELMSMDVALLKKAFSWSFLCNDYFPGREVAKDWMRARIAFLEERDGVRLGTQPLQDIGRYVQIGADMVDLDAIVAAHDAKQCEKDGL